MAKTHNRFIYHCLSCGAICCREPHEPVPVCCRKPMERAAAETVHDCDAPIPGTTATVPAPTGRGPESVHRPTGVSLENTPQAGSHSAVAVPVVTGPTPPVPTVQSNPAMPSSPASSGGDQH